MGSKRLDYLRRLVKERGLAEIKHEGAGYVLFDDESSCMIQDGVTLGLDGFGYEKNEDGEWEKFPHYGFVLIGPRVDIYTGTAVQRGSLDDTVICEGTKIGPKCQIGHNSKIGKHCLIGAYTIVCGSAVLGDGVITGEYVRIAPHVKIGNNVKISSYTNVTKDLANDSHVRGIPGKLL